MSRPQRGHPKLDTLCAVEGCTHHANYGRKGFCHKHYARQMRTGAPDWGGREDGWARIKAHLQDHPGDAEAVAVSLGMRPHTVRSWLRKKHAATPQEVYIADWKRPKYKGKNAAIYALGDLPDVACTIVPYTRKEVVARHHAKMVSTGEIHHDRAKRNARYWKAKAKKTRNTWLGPLMGAA